MSLASLYLNLDKKMKLLSENFLTQFRPSCELAHAWVMTNDGKSFAANVFLESQSQAEALAGSDLQDRMMAFLSSELVKLGFADQEIQLRLRLGSREEVDRDFGGSFYHSMR